MTFNLFEGSRRVEFKENSVSMEFNGNYNKINKINQINLPFQKAIFIAGIVRHAR